MTKRKKKKKRELLAHVEWLYKKERKKERKTNWLTIVGWLDRPTTYCRALQILNWIKDFPSPPRLVQHQQQELICRRRRLRPAAGFAFPFGFANNEMEPNVTWFDRTISLDFPTL